MKLLHVAASYVPAHRYGGTIVSVHGLCRALAARGHQVHVYTTSVDGPDDLPVPHGEPVDVDGVTVWYFRSPRVRRLYHSPQLGQALRANVAGFDVVHTHGIFLWPLWTAAREAHRSGVPYVVSPRGMLEKNLIERKNPLLKASLIGFIERRTLERAAAVHVTSAREADEAAAFGFDLPALREIPNGVEAGAAGAPVSSPIAARVSGPPFMLFMGRLSWKKGLDRLIAALPHAAGVPLIIAGDDEDGYRATIESMARRLGVAERVTFVGPVSGGDKMALLRAARALVLPSYSENFGNVVLESMAAGRPAIVTPEVGVADVVRSSGAGLICDGGAEALGRALAHLMDDAATADRMGARGLVAAQRYTWDGVAAQMEQLYGGVRRSDA